MCYTRRCAAWPVYRPVATSAVDLKAEEPPKKVGKGKRQGRKSTTVRLVSVNFGGDEIDWKESGDGNSLNSMEDNYTGILF